MCNHPITIANRSRRFTEGVSKMHLQVPCGYCHECAKLMQDDWFVRAFFEFQRIKKYGSCWFPTLTYDDENLPSWKDDEYIDPLDSSRSFVRPCFSVKHLKRFRDRFRVYLHRLGYDNTGVRFFVACELGGEFGRPHYHVLIFCPFRISFSVMWKLLHDAWPLGRIGFSSKFGMLVRSDKAVQYCCKYVSKNSSWFRKFGLQDYLWYLIKQYKLKIDGAEEKLKSFRRAYRLHFQSLKFGELGVKNITKEMLVDDRINLFDFGLDARKDLKSCEFRVPLYYKRKLLVMKDKFNTDIPTDLYFDVRRDRFFSLVNSLEDVFMPYFDKSLFVEHFGPLNMDFNYLSGQYDQLRDLLADCSVPASPRSLAIYSLVYKDLFFPVDNPDNWEEPLVCKNQIQLRYSMSPEKCLEHLLHCAPFVYAYGKRYEVEEPTPEHKSRFDVDRKFFNSHPLGYGDLPCFHGYENFLTCVSQLESQLGFIVSQSAEKIEDDLFDKSLILGIFNQKYSFLYNSIFEL